MPRSGWRGSSIWLGAGVTLVIHLIAGGLLTLWDAPTASTASRLVSVLIAAPEPQSTPPPTPPARPASTKTPRVDRPPPTEAAPTSTRVFVADEILAPITVPYTTSATSLMSFTTQTAPRTRVGVDSNSLPTRMLLNYSVRSSIVDGRAQYDFRRQGSRYTISGFLEADGFFAQMFAGRFEQESEGDIGPEGLAPRRFSLKRGDAQAEIATFNREQGKVIHQRIKSEHVQALEPGAQDLQSFIFQFGPAFTHDPAQQRIVFAITNARKMDRYEFEVRGRETITTVLGDLETLHLVRRADDPADAYEAWLSPRHQYLPVRLRYLLGGRFQVEQNLTGLKLEP